MKLTHGYRWLPTLLAAVLLAACSNDTPDTSAEAQEIRFNADVWHVMDGTRATTYNDATDLQTEGSFACSAYAANTITAHFTSQQVNWNSSASKWEFSTPQKWPGSDVSYDALDFFAYMPAIQPDYITSINYTTARSPQITCDLRNTVDKEFVWTLITRQTQAEQGRTGVALHFTHPFARVRFVLSPESGDHVTVTSVTISDVNSTGTCTLSADGATSTWSSQDDAATFGGLIGTDYIAVPQTFTGSTQTVTVEAEWEEWTGGVTKTFSTNVTMAQWEAGKSYTYTLTLQEYALKVSTDKYTEQW